MILISLFELQAILSPKIFLNVVLNLVLIVLMLRLR